MPIETKKWLLDPVDRIWNHAEVLSARTDAPSVVNDVGMADMPKIDDPRIQIDGERSAQTVMKYTHC